MINKTFASRLRELRALKRLSLREYCRRLGKDAGNVSKVERGLISPPKDEEIVRQFGEALGLTGNSPEMKELIELAAIESHQIPRAIMQDKEVVSRLPLFFRTVTGSKVERAKLLQFLDELKKT